MEKAATSRSLSASKYSKAISAISPLPMITSGLGAAISGLGDQEVVAPVGHRQVGALRQQIGVAAGGLGALDQARQHRVVDLAGDRPQLRHDIGLARAGELAVEALAGLGREEAPALGVVGDVA